ncbi:MAG: sulfurtransferase TusA family protein [Hyphomicrobiaceae bacterium]|nr:sulfurtransferase TusA family protein [Hyphomicrobiaceae bacterium]
MATTQLDATGLKCPIPVLKARKAVRSLSPGDTLEVLSTDPGSVPDFEAFCDTGGHELLEQAQDGRVFRFLIRIAG